MDSRFTLHDEYVKDGLEMEHVYPNDPPAIIEVVEQGEEKAMIG